jgi:hypothetical protein
MMILLYGIEQEAIDALSHLEAVAKQLWAAAGYTVDGYAVIAKDKYGNNVPEARATRWDNIKQHPDGGYYFISPRSQYPDYFAQLVSGDYTETDYQPPIYEETL